MIWNGREKEYPLERYFYYESCAKGHVIEQTGIPHLSDVYAPDFLHPNEMGFTFMAQGIAQKLESLLNR